MRRTYKIYKNVNNPIEFKGFKGQYLFWIAASVIGVFLFTALLHSIGINDYLCALITLALLSFSIYQVSVLSRKYGRYGLMKKRAGQKIPKAIKANSRRIFMRRP